MKTDAAHTTRTEPPRTQGATTGATRALRPSEGTPADLFATLLSGLEAALPGPTAPGGDVSGANTSAPLADDRDLQAGDDPRAAFLGLLQPQTIATPADPAPASAAPGTVSLASFTSTDMPDLSRPDQTAATNLPSGPNDTAPPWSELATAEDAAAQALTPEGQTGPAMRDTTDEIAARFEGAWTNPKGRAPAAGKPHGLPSQTAQLQHLPLNAAGAALQQALTDVVHPRAGHPIAPGQPGAPWLTDANGQAGNTASTSTEAAMGLGLGHSSHQTGAQGDGTPSGNQPQGRVWLEAPGTAPTADAAPSTDTGSFARSLGEALGDAYETLGSQISLWAGSQTKRASVHIDMDRDQALDVEVRVEDGQAHLAFRTDDPQVRDQLRAQAQAVLSELLARAGIGLESLSVGAQHAGTQSGSGSPQEAPLLRIRVSQDAAQDGLMPERHTGGRGNPRGLDVYA